MEILHFSYINTMHLPNSLSK